MGTIIKKPNGKYLARVRHSAQDGRPAFKRTATFPTRIDAESWVAKIEGEWYARKAGRIPKVEFGCILQRYLEDVVPDDKVSTRRNKQSIINYLLEDPIAYIYLTDLCVADVEELRERLLQRGLALGTINQYLALLGHVGTMVVKWEIMTHNPLKGVQLAKTKARSTRITDDFIREYCQLAGYVDGKMPSNKKALTALILMFALETAMRANEILVLKI